MGTFVSRSDAEAFAREQALHGNRVQIIDTADKLVAELGPSSNSVRLPSAIAGEPTPTTAAEPDAHDLRNVQPEGAMSGLVLDVPGAGLDQGFLDGPATSAAAPVGGTIADTTPQAQPEQTPSLLQPGVGGPPSSFGFGEAGDRTGFNQAPFGDFQAQDSEQRTARVRVTAATIERNGAHIFALAISLERMARNEIERLENEYPNDPQIIERHKSQRELLTIFAEGFRNIAEALEAVGQNQYQPVFLGIAAKIIGGVAAELSKWWDKHAAEAVDWAIRLPILTASIATFNLAGADMTYGTGLAAAAVGGEKVIQALEHLRKPK